MPKIPIWLQAANTLNYENLIKLTEGLNSDRPEIEEAKASLGY